jgi:WD40-like Beta Propeller Repeat
VRLAAVPLFAVECRVLPCRACLHYNRVLDFRQVLATLMDAPSRMLPPVQAQEERLDSWKEIAAYFKRDITTVQRWEKREGMPVHRHLHDRTGSVNAFRTELDAWARGRQLRAGQEIAPDNGLCEAAPEEPRSAIRIVQGRIVQGRWRLSLLLATAGAVLTVGAILWLQIRNDSWRNPIAGARFQSITELDEMAQAAVVSRDGQFVAFLSDRDGQMDVWITQVGSGQFHNLTRGRVAELVNPSVRTLGFSPDGTVVTFWIRKAHDASGSDISVWAVPTMGGQPRPYLEGVAELDWSHEGSRLAYHTPGPGDPLFVSDAGLRRNSRPIYNAPAGLHAHFPLWAPDDAFIYFVQGSLPDQLDIWRITPDGRTTQRITSHGGLISHPVLLNSRTLLYLATDSDGSGPWLYAMDLRHAFPTS